MLRLPATLAFDRKKQTPVFAVPSAVSASAEGRLTDMGGSYSRSQPEGAAIHIRPASKRRQSRDTSPSSDSVRQSTSNCYTSPAQTSNVKYPQNTRFPHGHQATKNKNETERRYDCVHYPREGKIMRDTYPYQWQALSRKKSKHILLKKLLSPDTSIQLVNRSSNCLPSECVNTKWSNGQISDTNATCHTCLIPDHGTFLKKTLREAEHEDNSQCSQCTVIRTSTYWKDMMKSSRMAEKWNDIATTVSVSEIRSRKNLKMKQNSKRECRGVSGNPERKEREDSTDERDVNCNEHSSQSFQVEPRYETFISNKQTCLSEACQNREYCIENDDENERTTACSIDSDSAGSGDMRDITAVNKRMKNLFITSPILGSPNLHPVDANEYKKRIIEIFDQNTQITHCKNKVSTGERPKYRDYCVDDTNKYGILCEQGARCLPFSEHIYEENICHEVACKDVLPQCSACRTQYYEIYHRPCELTVNHEKHNCADALPERFRQRNNYIQKSNDIIKQEEQLIKTISEFGSPLQTHKQNLTYCRGKERKGYTKMSKERNNLSNTIFDNKLRSSSRDTEDEIRYHVEKDMTFRHGNIEHSNPPKRARSAFSTISEDKSQNMSDDEDFPLPPLPRKRMQETVSTVSLFRGKVLKTHNHGNKTTGESYQSGKSSKQTSPLVGIAAHNVGPVIAKNYQEKQYLLLENKRDCRIREESTNSKVESIENKNKSHANSSQGRPQIVSKDNSLTSNVASQTDLMVLPESRVVTSDINSQCENDKCLKSITISKSGSYVCSRCQIGPLKERDCLLESDTEDIHVRILSSEESIHKEYVESECKNEGFECEKTAARRTEREVKYCSQHLTNRRGARTDRHKPISVEYEKEYHITEDAYEGSDTFHTENENRNPAYVLERSLKEQVEGPGHHKQVSGTRNVSDKDEQSKQNFESNLHHHTCPIHDQQSCDIGTENDMITSINRSNHYDHSGRSYRSNVYEECRKPARINNRKQRRQCFAESVKSGEVPPYEKAVAIFERKSDDAKKQYNQTLYGFREMRQKKEVSSIYLDRVLSPQIMNGINGLNGHGDLNGGSGELISQNLPKGCWTIGLINSKFRYLTAETFGFKINANGASLKKKQVWTLEPSSPSGSDSTIYLRSHLDKYLAVDSFGNVTCESEEKDPGSKFQISVADDNTGRWAFRNVIRGYYLGASADKLTCTAKVPGDAAFWHVHLAARPQVNLRSVGRKRFAHLSENLDEIHVDANIPWGEDTLFTLEFRVDESGKYALHTCNNKYLSREGKLVDECNPNCLFSAEYHSGQLALRDRTGAYLSPIGSKAVLKSRSNTVTKDELFSLEDSLPQASFVAALNARYVSVKQGVDVTANQDEISDHETFQLEFDGSTKRWYIRTMQDRYWTLETGGGIQACSDKKSSNALFDLVWQGDGSVAFRANNGKYVATKRSGHLYANCDAVDDNAKYFFYLINRPILVLKCEQGFVGYKSATSPKLECNKATYETIQVERSEKGVVFFKGQNGKYWHVDGETVTADSDTPEGFFLELREPTRICIKSVGGEYLIANKNGAFRLGDTDYENATKWEY